jgi:succinate dehydrogenase flavin-adding protein (antitoxin of CptAB toxin-antitoxin module)
MNKMSEEQLREYRDMLVRISQQNRILAEWVQNFEQYPDEEIRRTIMRHISGIVTILPEDIRGFSLK